MKAFIEKYLNKKVLLTYIYGAFASRLLGFIVSMWAVSLVGHFFEFPSMKNLWGINSHKALVSKETFENLKWVAQVVIGFFVFEVFHKTMFAKITQYVPEYYQKGINYLDEKGHLQKAKELKDVTLTKLKEKSLVVKEKAKEIVNKTSNA